MQMLVCSSLVLLLAACGGGSTSSTIDGGMHIDVDGAVPCAPDDGDDGRWGAPAQTFTLPCPNVDRECYYPNLAASFPEVDWDTLERLYLPAGEYRLINLGGLPERDPATPLVISNSGGQVHLVGNGGYAVALNGGSGWVFTGRYDPISLTGDQGFAGHRGGAYATSRGHYGFDVSWSPDDPADPPLVAVGDGAHDFEVEFLEIHRGNFCGLMVNRSDSDEPIERGKLHDLYIHDMLSEGFYIGSTASPPVEQPEVRGFEIYNNRVVRTGTEMLQIGQMSGGNHVHHNVFFLGALAYRAPFAGDGQDNGWQLGPRRGSNELDHNVVIGGAHSDMIILGADLTGADPAMQPQPGDTLSIHHNYVAASRWRGIYFRAAR